MVVDHEQPDFAVFRFPDGDKLEASGDGYFWQHFRAPDGKVFDLVCDRSHP